MPRTPLARVASLSLALAALTLGACQNSPARVQASAEQDRAMFDRIAALEGEWQMTDEQGQTHTASVFNVSSGGSVVREIMFPGHEHEMTNLYHMDGRNLVITHYCAAGNQPRMVAREARRTADGTEFVFDLDTVSNLRPEHDHFMGDLTLTVLNDGRIRQQWRSFDKQGNLGEPTVFVMTRKKS